MATPVRTFLSPPGPPEIAPARFVVRALGIAAALVIVTCGWMLPWCRTSEGALDSRFAAVLAAAAAGLVLSFTTRSRWAQSGRWLALSLAGPAGAPAITKARILIHYQHYRLPSEALRDPFSRCSLALALLQSGFVATGLFLRRRAIRQWLQHPRRLACLTAGVLLCG